VSTHHLFCAPKSYKFEKREGVMELYKLASCPTDWHQKRIYSSLLFFFQKSFFLLSKKKRRRHSRWRCERERERETRWGRFFSSSCIFSASGLSAVLCVVLLLMSINTHESLDIIAGESMEFQHSYPLCK